MELNVATLNYNKIKLKEGPLSGNCHCDFAVLSFKKDFIQNLLPDKLIPSEHPLPIPAEEHPVFIMFNKTFLQSNTPWAIGDFRLRLRYHEFIIGIPYVEFKNSPTNHENGPFIFLPVLYLNSLPAVIGGRIFYEFNKLMKRINVGEINFKVNSFFFNNTILKGQINKDGISVPGEILPNFNTITPIFNLPVVEHGIYGYVTSDYNISYENAIIQPSSIKISNISCPYMPVQNFNIPSIQESFAGAFQFNYDWSLSFIKFLKF